MSEKHEDVLPEEEKKAPVVPKKTTTTVTYFSEKGTNHILCEDGKGHGYMIPRVLCNTVQGVSFEVDLSHPDIVVLYDWSKEIEAMLPSKAEMIATARRALWRNGAISKESAKENYVQQRLMRGVFPYRIEIKEND